MTHLPDEALYALILISSVFVGFPLRHLKSPSARKLVTGGLGALTVICVCHVDFAYSFICFLINTLIIKFSRLKHVTLWSFIWCFSYLLFFRLTYVFGLPEPSRLANAVQLIQTLKLVSVASDIGDYRQSLYKKQANDAKHRFRLQLDAEPDVVNLFCYSYCYVGLFTGPFFTYRTFHDYVNSPPTNAPPVFGPLATRVVQLLLFAPTYYVINKLFNVDGVKSSHFDDYSFLFRMFYIAMVFMVARLRFYSAWLTAECSFITLGFGAYPVECKPRAGNGPTSSPNELQCGKMTFATIENVDPWNCEVSPTVRIKMRNWNKSVQWWLVTYVHRKFPITSIRDLVVLVVSAYWHGINAGFFGAFCTMVLVSKAEDGLHRLADSQLPAKLKAAFYVCCCFFNMRSVDYMYISFALLEWRHVWRVWSCMHWWVHTSAVLLILLCPLFAVKPEREVKKKQ